MIKSKLSTKSRAFINILADLTERDRIILIERFIKDKSLKKVAKQLGVSDITIREREERAIKNIEQTFEYLSI